ncbi:histidine kinase [Zhihengliuella sp.]|uniref:sensor histidine kinase n=1 Tax=Zhihengliuella sp. TaxID=1954483 RepID=UPI00281157B4|nr:histidine kinase [Zhihengliuella sp.]
MSLPRTVHERNSHRAMNAFWWWTWASLVFLYAVMYTMAFGELVRGNEALGGGTAARVFGMVQLALLSASALAAVLTSLQFRNGWPDEGPAAWRVAGTVGLAPLLLALSSWATPEAGLAPLLPLWLAVSHIACLVARPARWRLFWAGTALVAAIAVVFRILHPDAPWMTGDDSGGGAGPVVVLVYGALIPPIVLGSVWWWDAIVRLQRGRAAERELAVARERLRIAADLHDIQGHHLQVIALQAELAERLVERDPAGALEQIGKVRLAAAEAMGETRAVVSGLRRVGFATELENAADVLRAAGIDCRVQGWGRELAGTPREALGWVIREASTNILRHAQATRAELRLEEGPQAVTLTVRNDGVAPATAPGGEAPAGVGPSGLLGLRDRIEQAGGRFEAGLRDGEFVVRATVPVTPVPGPEATVAAGAPSEPARGVQA